MSADPNYPYPFPASGAAPPPGGSPPEVPLSGAEAADIAEPEADASGPSAHWSTGAPSALPPSFPSASSPFPPAPAFASAPVAPAFESPAPAAAFPSPPSGFRRQSGNIFLGLLLIGGGALILVSLGIVAGIGWAFSGRVDSDLWRDEMILTIEDADIPRSEKSEIIGHVNRLAAACQSGEVSRDQLRAILTRLEESPVFVAMDVGGIERDIFVQSGLSAEERQAARGTLVRAVRGVFLGRISIDDFYAALPPGYYMRAELTAFLSQEELDEFYAHFDDGPYEPATDEQVRQSLARLDKLARDAGLRAEFWSIDLSDEFGKALDEARQAAGRSQRSEVGGQKSGLKTTQLSTDN